MKCRKCGKELEVGGMGETDVELYNGLYGCDTDCEYVWFRVGCDCGDSFETGDFGCYLNEEQRAEWLEDFIEEYERKVDETG